MGTGDENRWWPDPEVFDIDPESGWYRRFFDIDDLAAVRVERQEVFDLLHGKVLELVRDGVIDGVRVDHPDGLADPAGYLRRLRDADVRARVGGEDPRRRRAPARLAGGRDGRLRVPRRRRRAVRRPGGGGGRSPTCGTTVSGDARPFEELMIAEAQLELATGRSRARCDRLRGLLGDDDAPIAEALAELPVYRTYVEPWSGVGRRRGPRGDRGRRRWRRRSRGSSLLEERGHDEFVTRFQQTSPPVTAKGVEDTAFYRYGRLLALNEVGGEPARFGVSVADFHAANARARAALPAQPARHEHARHEALGRRARAHRRARLDARRVGGAVRRWLDLTRDLVTDGAPDGAERYMVLQNVLAAWPITAERLEGFVEKSLREAKVHTTWAEPDEAYEAAVKGYATGLLTHEAFLADFEPFLERARCRSPSATRSGRSC